MALKIAQRGTVPPFIVMDVMRAAAEREAAGGATLHLEVGQPSTGLPRRAAEAVQALLASGQPLGYTVALGLPELRSRIAGHYARTHGVDVPAERVVATMGSSAAFVLAFLSAFEVGDRVGVTQPGYPAYRHILKALGITPVPVPVGPATRFQPTVEVLEGLGETAATLDGLIVTSPSNPTGTVMPADELRRVAAWCDAHKVRLVSDEIYHGITYGMDAETVAGFAPDAIIINSFSKYFCMTGWRLGWLVLPEDMVRPVECLAQNLFISPPTLSQHAGIAVFDCEDELQANVARYARNREVLLQGLPGAGFDRLAPADGAFYLYADVAHLTNDSLGFCRRMLAETGVAATPGVDFDAVEGDRFVRFSFAGATEDMEKAVAALTAWRR
ncbi:pyridoxal phosphate-dependent aminotransferase [Caenispirillum bisanense]|uniref:aspartate transaminase n=1 Tax=Caenispirillum bisanense TaxID=414052 RepID=A0A286GR87_9PROT|nr:aminotransferase class I/II-fold pyridoxal phosphate-dependent enzyme [Caenispirillum bisanense]SOD98053.1 Aspartate/methionine/tyrosine aminotransferase [Caenispirillum bisanense]